MLNEDRRQAAVRDLETQLRNQLPAGLDFRVERKKHGFCAQLMPQSVGHGRIETPTVIMIKDRKQFVSEVIAFVDKHSRKPSTPDLDPEPVKQKRRFVRSPSGFIR